MMNFRFFALVQCPFWPFVSHDSDSDDVQRDVSHLHIWQTYVPYGMRQTKVDYCFRNDLCFSLNYFFVLVHCSFVPFSSLADFAILHYRATVKLYEIWNQQSTHEKKFHTALLKWFFLSDGFENCNLDNSIIICFVILRLGWQGCQMSRSRLIRFFHLISIKQCKAFVCSKAS